MLINAIFFANVLAQLGVSIEFSQAETRIQIQGEAAAQTGEASALEPITYHVGGTVISEPLTIYYIYYGAWSAAQKAVIKTFTDGLGASDWWGMSTKYYALNNGKTFVTSSITYGKDVDDNYSMGKQLTGGSTQKIVQSKLNDGSLPYDINGIYFLLTSKDVSESSGPSNTFCANYCGYHAPRFTPSGQPILIAMAGHADACPQQSCTPDNNMKKSPNNDVGLDAMLSIVAHEISETATDPLFKSWYDINGEENADLCVWEYGIRTKLDSNGAVYNQVIGGANFLIQNNYDLERNACHDGQGEARAVEAPSMTPSTNWWDALFANIARFFGRR